MTGARDQRSAPDDFDVVAPASSPVDVRPGAARIPGAGFENMSTLRPLLRPYEAPDWRSAVQLTTAVAGFVGGWLLAVRALDVHYGLTLAAAVVIAASTMRMFIIFHDCGHGSFSRSRRLNDAVGSALGVLVWTPFRYWNYAHTIHHATSSDLDRRGVGDVWTLTVEEWHAAPPLRRLAYRAYHSPWVLFTIAPVIKFVLIERIVTRPRTTPARVKRSVHLTNAGIAAFVVAMVWALGPSRFLAVQIPALVIGGSGAIWLFYVQHRFEDTHWTRRDEWRYVDAGLAGSSYLRLGRVLQYVSGNIGFHHIHHLDARIPNYNLPRCHRDLPDLAPRRTFTLRESLEARHLKLWDESGRRFVDFATARGG